MCYVDSFIEYVQGEKKKTTLKQNKIMEKKMLLPNIYNNYFWKEYFSLCLTLMEINSVDY